MYAHCIILCLLTHLNYSEHNIPAHLTTALAQDHNGFLWIGTQDGLVRYDGYQFKTFQSKLGGSYIRTLYVASDGRLWIGTFSAGLLVIDPKYETFIHYRHISDNPNSLTHDRVETIVEDTQRFKTVASNQLAGQLIVDMIQDTHGKLWLATAQNGAAVLDPVTSKFTRLKHQPNSDKGLSHFWIYGFAQLNGWHLMGRHRKVVDSHPTRRNDIKRLGRQDCPI
jgi:ligand-binding sensor domain-containing protein